MPVVVFRLLECSELERTTSTHESSSVNGICCSLSLQPHQCWSRNFGSTLGRLQPLLLRGSLWSPVPALATPSFLLPQKSVRYTQGFKNSRQNSGREQPNQDISPSCSEISLCYPRAEPSVFGHHHSSPRVFPLLAHSHSDSEGIPLNLVPCPASCSLRWLRAWDKLSSGCCYPAGSGMELLCAGNGKLGMFRGSSHGLWEPLVT